MIELAENSAFFGTLICLVGYCLGLALKKRFKTPLLNPLLTASALIITVLLIFDIDPKSYGNGAEHISFLLTPATVCLAIPLHVQTGLLRRNFKAVIFGIASGVVTSLCTILALSAFFGFSHEEYVTFLPKSVTTAIGIGISEELGGYVPVTAAVIIITGITGSVLSELVFRIFRIEEPVAKGTALGSAAHAMGTAKALESGELEGAVSSLSIVVSGIFTVIGASVFAKFY